MTEVTEAPTTRVMEVLYCGNCGAPPEYCEFGTTLVECKAWLRTADNDLSVHLYGAEVPVEEVQDQVASLDIAAQGDGSTATAAPTKSSKKNAAANSSVKKVVLTTIERTKRKRITVVSGLEKFDVDLKKAAKQMASKFACGTSVTKNSQGVDEIIVQGEFSDDIFELILKTWPAIEEKSIQLGDAKSKK